jgi:hypothetical protein
MANLVSQHFRAKQAGAAGIRRIAEIASRNTL